MQCRYLSNKFCNVLQVDCYILQQQKAQRCAFADHYDWLSITSPGKPIANQIRSQVKSQAILNWTGFVKAGTKAGRKNMTAIPLENAVRDAIKRALQPLSVSVANTAKGFNIGLEIRINVDCLISKDKYPTSIVSIKTYFNPEAVRETFAYFYLAKSWYGQRSLKGFVVALNPIDAKLRKWIDALKNYIDGAYSLSAAPYIDDLLEKLRRIYNI